MQHNSGAHYHAGCNIDAIRRNFERLPANSVMAFDDNGFPNFVQPGHDGIAAISEIGGLLKLSDCLFRIVDVAIRTAIHTQSAVPAAPLPCLDSNARLSEMDTGGLKWLAVFFKLRA